MSLAQEKIKVWFVLNAYCFCTIVKLKKSNPWNSGTICIPEGKRIIERLRLAFSYLVECDMQGAESSGLLPPHVNLTCLPLCLLFPPMVSLLLTYWLFQSLCYMQMCYGDCRTNWQLSQEIGKVQVTGTKWSRRKDRSGRWVSLKVRRDHLCRLGKARVAENKKAAVLKERWRCTSIYWILCHTCYSVSSSQQLYETGIVIIILPIWQRRKLIQINTAYKDRTKSWTQGIWLLSSVICHTQLRYITGAHINSSASDKQNRWRGDILIRFLGALKVLRTLFGRLWKMKKGFPLIPLKVRVCSFLDTLKADTSILHRLQLSSTYG